MISHDSNNKHNQPLVEDFTVENYKELLQLAGEKWTIVKYRSIPWHSSFLLWRHDVDCSLNRSLELAKLEYQAGINATYFINLHSQFYNCLEHEQFRIVKEILSLGHDLGLHFDASFYEILCEEDLNKYVTNEAEYLESIFGVKPVAFSFHNPTQEILGFRNDSYGGLINCYSERFRSEVSYCSDSNGYWRFKRLYDVLSENCDNQLQVLTHPDWWQLNSMPPRQRIFRSVYGRAEATMRSYDAVVDKSERVNDSGVLSAINFLKPLYPGIFEFYDYLWNKRLVYTLYIELFCLCENQMLSLCISYYKQNWNIPEAEIKSVIETLTPNVDKHSLLQYVFNANWQAVTGTSSEEYARLLTLFNTILFCRRREHAKGCEEGVVTLCQIIKKMMDWEEAKCLNNNYLEKLYNIECDNEESNANYFSMKNDMDSTAYISTSFQWEQFKQELKRLIK
ncbi:MAG: hypothetical protein RLT87_10545 [Gammaproteobacteria bacterium]